MGSGARSRRPRAGPRGPERRGPSRRVARGPAARGPPPPGTARAPRPDASSREGLGPKRGAAWDRRGREEAAVELHLGLARQGRGSQEKERHEHVRGRYLLTSCKLDPQEKSRPNQASHFLRAGKRRVVADLRDRVAHESSAERVEVGEDRRRGHENVREAARPWVRWPESRRGRRAVDAARLWRGVFQAEASSRASDEVDRVPDEGTAAQDLPRRARDHDRG